MTAASTETTTVDVRPHPWIEGVTDADLKALNAALKLDGDAAKDGKQLQKQLGVPVVIHAFDRSVTEALRRLKVDYLIDSKDRGVARLADELKQAGVAAT